VPRALIGRDAEVGVLLTAVRDGRRLISILGPPGIGKTTLARAAAEAVGSALFCELSSASSEEALASAVLGALQAQPADHGLVSAKPAVSPTDRVARLLQERGQVLLVLDNFDRVAFSAAVVARWLAAAPSLVTVVTSRERLALPDELVIELAPLAYPPSGSRRDDLVTSHAVQLFHARATDAGAAGLDDWEAIADVVRRLEGIPLAIELAASRARLMTPRELARRLERGYALLSAPGLPERHRTLFSAIAWSWELLHADERLALAVSALFEGSFTVERAEVLVGLALERQGGARRDALDLLAQLRDKSLVRLDEVGRLRIFESIREYALLRMDELGDATTRASREDHCRSFGDLAERFIAERLFLAVEPRPEVVAEARLEAENIVAAHRFLATVNSSQLDGRVSCGRQLGVALTAAVAFLHAAPAAHADAALVRELARDDLSTSERAVLLLARESSLGALGRHEEAVAVGRVAVELPDLDPGLKAFALVCAGTQLRADGDARGALRLHEQAEEVLAGRRSTRLHGMNLSCMGRLACDLRLVERARELNAQASRLCDDLGDRFLAALGLANLAQLEQEVRSFHRAEQLYLDAIGRFSSAHEPHYRGIYETRLATLYLEWSRLEEALAGFATAERSLGELHTPTSRVFLYAAWAFAEASVGRAAVAAKRLELAREAAQRGAQGVTGLALELLGGAVELLQTKPDATAVSFWRDRASVLDAEDDARSQVHNLDVRFAFRMLAQALARHRAVGGSVLNLGPDALWFALEETERVDLARRGPMRRMLVALVAAREGAPGRTLDREALFSAGWPGERVLEEAASTRVRVAIATLRKLGLRETLLTRDDGYLLDPATELRRSEA
jgi:predicted ATPase